MGQLVRLTHKSDGNNACIFVTLCFAYQYAPEKKICQYLVLKLCNRKYFLFGKLSHDHSGAQDGDLITYRVKQWAAVMTWRLSMSVPEHTGVVGSAGGCRSSYHGILYPSMSSPPTIRPSGTGSTPQSVKTHYVKCQFPSWGWNIYYRRGKKW